MTDFRLAGSMHRSHGEPEGTNRDDRALQRKNGSQDGAGAEAPFASSALGAGVRPQGRQDRKLNSGQALAGAPATIFDRLGLPDDLQSQGTAGSGGMPNMGGCFRDVSESWRAQCKRRVFRGDMCERHWFEWTGDAA